MSELHCRRRIPEHHDQVRVRFDGIRGGDLPLFEGEGSADAVVTDFDLRREVFLLEPFAEGRLQHPLHRHDEVDAEQQLPQHPPGKPGRFHRYRIDHPPGSISESVEVSGSVESKARTKIICPADQGKTDSIDLFHPIG